MRSFLKLTSVTLLSTTITISTLILPVHGVITPPKTQCYIEIDNVHISTSLIETHFFNAIKANATSKCNQPMTHLEITVRIIKYGFDMKHLVNAQTQTYSGQLYANKKYVNQKTFAKCLDERSTKYFAQAYAFGTIHGRVYRTLVATSESETVIPCGT